MYDILRDMTAKSALNNNYFTLAHKPGEHGDASIRGHCNLWCNTFSFLYALEFTLASF